MSQGRRRVAVVAGVGPGNGAALARRFAAGGYLVALLARQRKKLASLESEIPGAKSFVCDVADSAAVENAFAAVRDTLGDVDALLYNAGSGVFADVEAITPDDFEAAWRVNALGALLCSRAVIPAMKQNGHGSIVFIGATASLRGNVNTAAFAPAKAAQRSLAQSMARKLWPAGVHVALVVVDGTVDIPRTREAMPDKPEDFFVDPTGVAETAFQLTQQNRRAWSFEVEARPFNERW